MSDPRKAEAVPHPTKAGRRERYGVIHRKWECTPGVAGVSKVLVPKNHTRVGPFAARREQQATRVTQIAFRTPGNLGVHRIGGGRRDRLTGDGLRRSSWRLSLGYVDTPAGAAAPGDDGVPAI